MASPRQVEPLKKGAAALQVSQRGVTQPGPVGLQTQLSVLQRVTTVLVQQLTGLGQTAEVWQGQVAQYQLDKLWMEDGVGLGEERRKEKGKIWRGQQKERGTTKHKTVRSVKTYRKAKQTIEH